MVDTAIKHHCWRSYLCDHPDFGCNTGDAGYRRRFCSWEQTGVSQPDRRVCHYGQSLTPAGNRNGRLGTGCDGQRRLSCLCDPMRENPTGAALGLARDRDCWPVEIICQRGIA